jgi:hypothetical protein
MLSAKCFFRGNFMTSQGAERLLWNLCAVSELTPEFWNIHEPINNPFRKENLDEVIYGSMVPSEKARNHFITTLAFFARKTKPRYVLSIDLRLAPVQGGTPHNGIFIDDIKDRWPGGEGKLAEYLSSCILPSYPDYARVVDSSQEDSERLNEFRRPLTAQELLQSMAEAQKRPPVAPFGPYGCLEDIYWFNYFGRVYVDFIGKKRLMAAGWAKAEEVGDGLACYATETIADPNARKRRLRIVSALEEFIWTPGCKVEDKRVPVFDFSEQLAALPADAAAKLGLRLSAS